MSGNVVYGDLGSPDVRSILFALEEKGAPYKMTLREARPILRTSENSADGEPALQSGGTFVRGAETILRFVEDGFAGPHLQPETARGRARMNYALELHYREAVFTLGPRIIDRYLGAIVRNEWLDPVGSEALLSDARQTVARIETLLAREPYLAGPEISLADIALSPLLDDIVQRPEGVAILSSDSPIRLWWARVSARPAFTLTKGT